MRESELLRRIYERTRIQAAKWPQVVVGPGDDCAVVRCGNGLGGDADVTLITVDQLVEGRHFTANTPVDLIARKAVARSISDVAAMGGSPRWALATGLLPDGYLHAAALTDSLHRWGEHWGAPMVGGDIAMGAPGTPLVLTVTVGGVAHPARGPVLRSGARAGDEVWVTGAFGGSLSKDGTGGGQHLTFEPRVREGVWLCETLGARLHAMIDVSDGLGRDAGRVASASGLRIEIDAALVPRSAGVGDVLSALGDGEDYELCFTIEAGAMGERRAAQGTPLTRIGRVVAGSGCLASIAGKQLDIAESGWDHGSSGAITDEPRPA